MRTHKHIHHLVRTHGPNAVAALCGLTLGLFTLNAQLGMMTSYHAASVGMVRHETQPADALMSRAMPDDLMSIAILPADPVTDTEKTENPEPAVVRPEPVERPVRVPVFTAPKKDTPAAMQVAEPADDAEPDFPPFVRAVHPVSKVPNWGAMRTPAEWNRSYGEMTEADFVNIPAYDLKTLTIPLQSLLIPFREENISVITAKLYYSTRYMGAYDLDAGEHTGDHAGVDLKLATGTPVGAIGGGRVYAVQSNDTLGKYIVIEHLMTSGERYSSIYGHLGSAAVSVGDAVSPGQTIGYVGMTGNTSAPHLHLEVNRGLAASWNGLHKAAGEVSVNPMAFIATY